MKIIGICGSPRKGNTEWMLGTFLETAAAMGAETELLLLRKLDIKRCTGCLTCDAGGKDRKGICTLKDDMAGIYPRLIEADAIVFGTPAYFDLLSGLLKNFMDRTCPIWPKLEGKKAAGIAVAEEGVGKAADNLKTYSTLCGITWIGSVTALARLPGEVAKNRDVEQKLKRLARKLVRSLNS